MVVLGGYFGDREGHPEIGRRGGQVRHERAMRAHRDDEGYAEDVGQGRYSDDPEGHAEIGRRGGQHRMETGSRSRQSETRSSRNRSDDDEPTPRRRQSR